MRDVSVIGIGETKMGKFPDVSLNEMIKTAGSAAIADAGINKKTIQSVYIGNFNAGYLCGQNHMGAMAIEALGLGTVPATRTEGSCASGGLAFRNAYIAVASGIYDVALAGGVEKMSHRSHGEIIAAEASAMDFEDETNKGLTFLASYAMIANRYFYEYRNVKKEMGMCAVHARANAKLNPDAQMREEVSLKEIMAANMIADPFSLYDCSPITDGAAFVVLAASDIAKGLTSKHRIVDVAGSGHAGDALTLMGKKDFTSFASTSAAAKEAYEQAGLEPKDIQFAEVHDCFTISQIISTEDLGFFEAGKGGDAVAEGKTARTGSLPVNVSGGLKAKGYPIGAAGISQIYEAVTQIRGEAGTRQLERADIGLTHNLGGTAGTCVVHIFRGR